jgi:hypothetical protein
MNKMTKIILSSLLTILILIFSIITADYHFKDVYSVSFYEKFCIHPWIISTLSTIMFLMINRLLYNFIDFLVDY